MAVDDTVVFLLSGRIREEHILELTELLASEKEGSKMAFDLEEIRLVDREGIRFLRACEARGIILQNCPAFVREWIHKGSDTGYGAKFIAL